MAPNGWHVDTISARLGKERLREVLGVFMEQLKLDDAAAAIVYDWADFVGFAQYKVHVKTEGKGFDERTRALGTGERIACLLLGFVHAVAAVGVVKQKFNYDDSLDAFGVHGIGGFWGMLATGLFATTAVNPINTFASMSALTTMARC